MIRPYDYIKNHVNVKLAPSSIHGVGIFALRDIEKGEKLFVEWNGETGQYFLNEHEFNAFDEKVKEHLSQMFGYVKDGEQIYKMSIVLNKNCHWIFKTPLHWVNSCGIDGEPNLNRETLTTTKFIKAGEEILLMYGKYNKFKKTKTI